MIVKYKHGLILIMLIAFGSLLVTANVDAKKNRRNKGEVVKVPENMEFRNIDGSGNNLSNNDFGSVHIELLRETTVNYADGDSSVSDTLPSARLVSNNMAAQSESIINDRNLTDMIWQWGQFLDHDIDLTEAADPAEALNISVPLGDVHFDPFSTGNQFIPLSRSEFSEDSSPRQQLNQITAFVDASNVYGSDEVRAAALRSFENGKLKVSENNLLPFNEEGLPNAGGTGANLFLAGDIRANEQVALAAMHTLFVREHNRVAEQILAKEPELDDETIYQRARAYVGALMQVITYKEFLPALMGRNSLKRYKGYKKDVNPGIMNSFSTAAYRFGHSTLSPTILRLDNDGNEIEEGNLSLAGAFFRPDLLNSEDDIGHILKGLASQNMQEIDNKVVDDVRNFLFGPPGSGGLDLASLNIQRGRDHGLASYNQTRRDFGLEAKNSFEEISSDAQTVANLQATYDSVEEIDLWVGLLAEDHLRGSSMGELMQHIISTQFERLRDGDRLWYQRMFKGKTLSDLERTRLSDVIKRNTQITNIQKNVFVLN